MKKKGRPLTPTELILWESVNKETQRFPWVRSVQSVEITPSIDLKKEEMLSQSKQVPTECGPLLHLPRIGTSIIKITHGLDRELCAQLKQGKRRVEATLDLHGMTQVQAYSALIDFMDMCWNAQKRCVLVITGKGMKTSPRRPPEATRGILREKVPHWLQSVPFSNRILSMSQSLQKDGGTGALYIVLRRPKHQ
jgi:DNA-nicking Smr family endonuclease